MTPRAASPLAWIALFAVAAAAVQLAIATIDARHAARGLHRPAAVDGP
jgi:hypothetical protein